MLNFQKTGCGNVPKFPNYNWPVVAELIEYFVCMPEVPGSIPRSGKRFIKNLIDQSLAAKVSCNRGEVVRRGLTPQIRKMCGGGVQKKNFFS